MKKMERKEVNERGERAREKEEERSLLNDF